MNYKKQLQDLYTISYECNFTNVIVVNEVLQDRPWTAVQVEANIVPLYYINSTGDDYAVAVGFSKVSYPDKWDEARGLRLAIDKAIAKLARRISDHAPKED